MNQNQNRKTLRHFQCRDFLWEIFEQMSAELECSIDYLINEAMRQYARARNYSPRQGAQGPDAMQPPTRSTRQVAPLTPEPMMAPPSGPPRQPVSRPPGPPPPLPTNRPQQPPRAMPPQMPQPGGVTAPRPANQPATGFPVAQPPPMAPMQQAMPVPQPMVGPQPMAGPPQGMAGADAMPPGAPRLYLIFNGRKLPVNKEQFIIGRGSKTSDLAIKDGNISRKHAAVILHQNVYYLKDLGSTNGIEYNGMRIDNKRIEEGDVFHICDYELRFTYR